MSESVQSQSIYQCLSNAETAEMEELTTLGNSSTLAIWNRKVPDNTRYRRPDHHTLSCYLFGGTDVHRLNGNRIIKGGAPGRICLMPDEHESDWNIASYIRFMHFYFSDDALRSMAGRIQDKNADTLELQDLTFIEDPWIKNVCQQIIMPLDWQDNADHITLSSAADMLMVHLLKNYCTDNYRLPDTKGGLSPFVQNRIRDYIEHHIAQPLSLLELAEQANLSEYHFARMFKQSFGLSPHQYVLERRLNRATSMLSDRQNKLSDIALHCGFSSQSHFSSRFKSHFGSTPAAYRKAI